MQINWETDHKAAFERARTERRDLFVDFSKHP